MFYAYMLRCADSSFYVGHSEALEDRITQHQRGFIKEQAKKQALIDGDWGRVSILARNRQDQPRPSTGSGRTGDSGGLHNSAVRPELVEGHGCTRRPGRP